MLDYLFINVVIIGCFLLLSGYVFKHRPLNVNAPIKTKIIAGLGGGHLGILLIAYHIHFNQNVIIDFGHIALYLIAIFGGPLSVSITGAVMVIYSICTIGTTTTAFILSSIIIIICAFDGWISMLSTTNLKKYIYINIFNIPVYTLAQYFLEKNSSKALIFLLYAMLFSISISIFVYFLSNYVKKGNIYYREMHYYRIMTENLSDMISTFNTQWKYQYTSPSTKKLLGYESIELIGTCIDDYIHPEDLAAVKEFREKVNNTSDKNKMKYRFRSKEGNYIWVETTVRSMKDGDIAEWITASRDISEQKDAEEKLKNLSYIDGLTQIHNRRYFNETIDREWHRAIRSSEPISLLILDIDFFKNYNDSYGHLQGDECLKVVAGSISNTLSRGSDFVTRFGGEEFAVIITNTDEKAAFLIAETARKNIEASKIENINSKVKPILTVSVGVATVVPSINSSSDELISNADKALYKAKENGRNRSELFSQL